MCDILYDSYPCKIQDVKINKDSESYEIPGLHGARISKYAPPGKIVRSYYNDVTTMIGMLDRGCRVSENGPCLGWRSSISEYSWFSYKEFMNRCKHFGAGLSKLGIKLGQSSMISIYAQNSVEWMVAQYGCFYYSLAVVPLYDTIGPESRNYMINNVEAPAVVCDVEKNVRAILENIEKTPTLKHIISINDLSDEIKELGAKKGISLHLFKDIEEFGKKSSVQLQLPKPSDTAIICYTSGTTGTPKGAVLTHENIISAIGGTVDFLEDKLPHKDDVSISFLPLPHVYEQLMVVLVLLHGGRIGFFSGDVTKLTDDMKVLRPTIFAAVPRVLNKIYDRVQSMFRNRAVPKTLENGTSKNESIESKRVQEEETLTYDPKLYKPVLDSMGGKIRTIFSSAAPISVKVLNFYRLALGCKVVEVYGQTECAGPCAFNPVTPYTVGSVGPPSPCNMIKLVDLPELGYFTEDGIGEVCIKGLNVFEGYYRNPEKTAESLDSDGWLHTGDVGIWLPNGYLKLVDRKMHIFKLSQGEYIMPEKIEMIYLSSPFISQLLVHGDGLQSYLVAIVIPETTEVLAWCKENSISGTWEEICKNPEVNKRILEDMQRAGEDSSLLSFQQVKKIHLHPEPLTIEAGHLTPTQKTKRDIVRKLFLEEIRQMYSKSSIN